MPVQQLLYQDASLRVCELYDAILEQFKLEHLPNWALYLGNDYSSLKVTCAIWADLYQNGTLPVLLKELIMFTVSREQASPYCAELHAYNTLFLAKNLDYDALIEIVDNKSQGVVPDQYHCAITVAKNRSQGLCNFVIDDQASLLSCGFNQAQVVEIMATCAHAMFLSTLTLALNIPIDPDKKVPGFRLK
ncbi:hypothetical protein [Pseudoalteromonas obscura]|uniref:Carboxymuconolactone decarboxylase-like domain-containing protein n=1 Tax=Pseudoalteromonas obscura TaxID=3048491 RepID=A0ABT7EJ82_9GAMM|nr:hypothetical protein [Pseudoalteromonas sp. P94(2023)]MDK2595110.1 hypothetical protein [Pseudoalteromonas sp. P94(2023)]